MERDTESRIMATLSYLGILILIPLIKIKQPNQFLKKHINCGLTLVIVTFIINTVSTLIAMPILLYAANLGVQSIADTSIVIVMTLVLYGLHILIASALGILQITLVVRAILGYEARLWVIKEHTFLS